MKNTKNISRHNKTVYMAQLAIFIAIILIMGIFVPSLGFIKVGVLEISLITIPVAIGGMIMGKTAGSILGLAFGLVSFYQCFGMSAFGVALMGINPFLTFLVCVVPRVLMGWLSTVIFELMIKADKKKIISYFAGGLFYPLLNTVFFMGLLLICFYNTEYMQTIKSSMGSANIFAFLIAFVGINGALEMPLGCIISGAVSKALSKAINKSR